MVCKMIDQATGMKPDHGGRCGVPRAFGQLPDTRAASAVREADALGDKPQPHSRSIRRQPFRAAKRHAGVHMVAPL